MTPPLRDIWDLLLKEDAPLGDKTSDSLKLPALERTAKVIAKEDLSLSGLNNILKFFPASKKVRVDSFFEDGDRVLKGQCICLLDGLWKDLLIVERPFLNWIGHFSGIASTTWKFQDQVKDTSCKILDTRKTTPLFRELEKQAVKDGGGFNHRHSLSDAMMLKENHLALYDFNIRKAVADCLESQPGLHLTVEVSNLSQLEILLQTKAHRVLLDNFNNEELSQAIQIIRTANSSIETEASGNMTLERVQSVAQIGLDFISVGALTHSAKQADISMLMDN